MHSSSDQVSPVSPLSPLSSCPASQRFRTILPTAHNFHPPKQRSWFPSPTGSPHKEPHDPTFSHPSYSYTQSPVQSSWSEKPSYDPAIDWNYQPSENTSYFPSASSPNCSDSQSPQTSTTASFPLPLKITTNLSAHLSIGLWRKQSRKKGCRRFKGVGSSTDLPPDSGSAFLNLPRGWNSQYCHASSSAPALPSQSWVSDEEGDDEEKDTMATRKPAGNFLLKHLSGYTWKRAFYGKVTNRPLIPHGLRPSPYLSNPVSLYTSQNDSSARRSGSKESFKLLLILFREHNTIVRIVKWLRREDVLNLVLVSRRVREGVLRSPTGLGLEDYETSDEIGNWNEGGSHGGALASQHRNIVHRSSRLADYPEMLGRLVWLLTLTASCKSAHPVPQQRVKLKFCVWCGGCICGECDISSYIPHSYRLRRLCFDCWRLCGNQKSNPWESVTLGSSTNLSTPGESLRQAEVAKARTLLCTCRVGDEWICPDCHSGGSFLELAGVGTRRECWVCGKAIASRWNLPAHGSTGTRGGDVWSLCLWCGKHMRVKSEDYDYAYFHAS